jgi:hypothetical protein
MGIDTTDGTSMNRDSVYDQFVCRFWLSRWPLWSFLVASTYSILMLTLERYVAIVHPVFYKVRKQRSFGMFVIVIVHFCLRVRPIVKMDVTSKRL